MSSETRIPSAFISYAQESAEHSRWVEDLATRLTIDGIDVRLDIWDVALGERFTDFMDGAVRDNTFVLCICTPAYTDRLRTGRGGVGYEGDLMRAEQEVLANHKKFIPVLRRGTDAELVDWMRDKRYVDLSGDPFSNEQYDLLLNGLYGRSLRPERGRNKGPDWAGESRRRDGIDYPPLRFPPDHGSEVWVNGPVELADLLEANPNHGRVFLYRRTILDRRHGWGRVDGALCAALESLIDDKYPADRDAGLTAAIYRLDPARPYRFGDRSFGTFVELAQHLADRPDAYLPALRNPNHSLWIYLAARVDAEAAREMRGFAADFARAAEEDRAAQILIFHRLVLRLRRLDGDPRLPFALDLLSDPGELLARSPAYQARAATALADPASLLSVWVDETAPGLRHSVSTWRRTTPGGVDTLPYALGRGVAVGPGEIRDVADAFAGDPETVAALWSGDVDLVARVENYLDTYQDASLELAAFEWLRDGGSGEIRPAVIRYVARRSAELAELVARAGLSASAADDPAEAAKRIRSLAAACTDASGTDWERALVPLIAQEPWRVMPCAVLPVVFRALQAERAMTGAERGQVTEALVWPAATVLRHPSGRVPSLLLRLGLWLWESARALDECGPADEAMWRAYLQRMNGVVTSLHREAYRKAWDPADDAAGAVVTAALARLDARGARLAFHDRHAREERAHALHAAQIRASIESDLRAASAAADVREAEQRVAWRAESRRADAVRPLVRAERRAWIAIASLVTGLVFFACLLGSLAAEAIRRIDVYRTLYPDEPRGAFEIYSNLFIVAEGDAPARLFCGLAILAASVGAAALAAAVRFGADAIVVPVCLVLAYGLFLVGGALARTFPVQASYAAPVAGAAAVALLWLCWRAAQNRRRDVEHAIGPFPSGRARRREARLHDAHEAAWLLADRRSLALSADPDKEPLPPRVAAPADPPRAPLAALRARFPRTRMRMLTRGAALSVPFWAIPLALHALQGRVDTYAVIVGVPEYNEGGEERLNAFVGASDLPRANGDKRVIFGPFPAARARRVGRELTRASAEQANGEFYVIVTPESETSTAGTDYFQRRHCGCR